MIKNKGLFLLWLSLLLTTVLFYFAKILKDPSVSISWVFVSQYISLIGITLLSISFILSGKFRLIEKLFGGLDKVYKIHHITGGVAFILLLHHPLFLAVNALPNLSLGWKYLWFSNIFSYNFGVAGLYLMLLLLILTLLVNLPYNLWLKTHQYMGLTLLLSSVHILTINSDVSRYMPLRFWIITLLAVSSWTVIYRLYLHRLFSPVYEYVISEIARNEDIIEVVMKPVSKRMNYSSGQFVFAEFKSLGTEEHPFSIASGSNSDHIKLGIKILGDYTLSTRDLKVGDKVKLTGPHGMFNEPVNTSKGLIWIAGGIGITPFLGMLEDQVNNPSRRIDLFYCVKTPSEAVFDKEIKSRIESVNHISYWQFCTTDRGRITAEAVIQTLGEVSNKKIMLCGPVTMMTSLADQFRKIGVKNRDIIFEDFNFK